VAFGAAPVRAEDYPKQADIFVNDYAGVIDDDAEARIRAELRTLRAETGVEATVLTIPGRGGFDASSSVEAFATALFNAWGIGDPARNDGLLMLVVADERAVRIELGAGYDQGYDVVAQDIVSRGMVPAIRDGRPSAAIEAGVRDLDARIARRHAARLPAEAPKALSPPERGGWVAWAIFGGIAAVVAFKTRIGRFLNVWKRCPNCGARTLDVRRKPGAGAGSKVLTTVTCRSCGHVETRESMPRMAKGSADRDKSFGGGRSGGGGATGRW
jgi:uncharacterized protein